MKQCTMCHLEKLESEFSKSKKKFDGLNGHCKECHKSYTKKWYLKNKINHLSNVKNWKKSRTKELQELVLKFLEKNSCIDCGETDVLVLEFDHKFNKEFNISQAIGQRVSIQKLETEMKKCCVRCANCHRRKTHKEQNSWKYKKVGN